MEEAKFTFPSKKKIRKLIRLYEVESLHIIFSDGYDSGKRVGILWRRNDLKNQMIGIEKHFKENGIEIKRYKNFGKVHSIWFVKKVIEN